MQARVEREGVGIHDTGNAALFAFGKVGLAGAAGGKAVDASKRRLRVMIGCPRRPMDQTTSAQDRIAIAPGNGGAGLAGGRASGHKAPRRPRSSAG